MYSSSNLQYSTAKASEIKGTFYEHVSHEGDYAVPWCTRSQINDQYRVWDCYGHMEKLC
jgi:hypothetical protein